MFFTVVTKINLLFTHVKRKLTSSQLRFVLRHTRQRRTLLLIALYGVIESSSSSNSDSAMKESAASTTSLDENDDDISPFSHVLVDSRQNKPRQHGARSWHRCDSGTHKNVGLWVVVPPPATSSASVGAAVGTWLGCWVMVIIVGTHEGNAVRTRLGEEEGDTVVASSSGGSSSVLSDDSVERVVGTVVGTVVGNDVLAPVASTKTGTHVLVGK